MLNRTQPPPVNEIKKAAIIRAKDFRLRNNIPVYYIKAGTQDLVKIELLFPAGMWQQPSPLTGSAASAMLQEGTSKRSAKEISEMVDYYGAFLETEITHDFAAVTVYSLNKHLESVLPVVEEILNDSVFPEQEWKVYVQNKKQKFIINNEKVQMIARKKFAELLFGNEHPYGHNVTEDDFENLKREEAYLLYRNRYTATDAAIIASGNVTEEALKLVEKHFGTLQANPIPADTESRDVKPQPQKGELYIEKKDAIQSAIRMGKPLFTKTHPDYTGMLVLNTVFGGYFGSRLMSNIREEKGYTYGIGSGLVSYTRAGYFTLSTEVGAGVTKDAIKEIYNELHRIQAELIPDSELELVRNYMLGTFLRSIDGPFNLADRFLGIYFHGLGYDYYDRYVETIRTITPQRLRDLANKYLKKEEFIEVVAGKRE